MKRVANVALNVDNWSEDLVGVSQTTRVLRSDFGLGNRTVTSVGGVSSDIGFSDTDAMVGQCSPPVQAGPSRVLAGFGGVDMPSLQELTAQENIPQRSRYYPSQAAKNLLKYFFELKPPTVLDPGHTATSLCVRVLNCCPNCMCSCCFVF